MLRLSLLSIASLFLFLSAHAQTDTENILAGTNARGEKVYLVRYAENRVWHVDEVVQHADGWPDLVSRKYFQRRDQAEVAQVQLQAKLQQVQSINPLMRNESAEMVLQGGSLWATTQSWNWDWEKKYAQWLTDNMDSGYFKKYGVATDCADVAYASRWIFARINGLPVANHLSGANTLMTNQSMRPEWANLPTAKNWYEDKRFKAALNYLLNLTYTHSLMRDSYPVAITPANFLPGIHHLDLREASGHTQLVHRVDISDQGLVPFQIIQSTTPRKVRELNESLFWGSELAKKGTNGFLRILWPKVKNGTYTLEKPENMPGYSLEQYDPGFLRDDKTANCVEVMLRLKPTLNFVNVLKSGFQNLKDMFQARIGVVEEGYRQCPKRSCAPDGSTYDAWSTPSRDKHIKDLMVQLTELNMMSLPTQTKTEMKLVTKQAMASTAVQFDGDDYTLQALYYAWTYGLFSSDPNDEPGLRWGITPEFFAQRLQKNLVKLLGERKTLISSLNDNILKTDFLIAQNYCGAVSDQQCLRFKSQELVKPLSILGQSKPLEAWLEQSLWLNSDPKQTPANQWGALRGQSKFQALPANLEHFDVSAGGIGYLKQKDGQVRIGPMGANGIEDQALPAGFQWTSFQLKEAIAWAAAPGKILSYDFSTQVQVVYTTPFAETAEILLFTPGGVVAKTPTAVWSLQFAGTALNSVWQEGLSSIAIPNDHLIVGQQGGHWSIYDFTAAQPQVYQSPQELTEFYLFKETSKVLGLYADQKSFFIEKGTGKVTDVSHLEGFLIWSDDLQTAILWKNSPMGIYASTLDSQFQVKDSRKIGDYGTTQDDFILAFSFTQPGKLYKMQNNRVEEVPLRVDEEGIADLSNSYIVTGIKGMKDRFRVRKLDSSQALLEGRRFMLLGNQKDMRWIFTEGSDESNVSLIDLKNPKAPALMTGEFFKYSGLARGTSSGEIGSIQRGVVLKYQGFRFWVEFP